MLGKNRSRNLRSLGRKIEEDDLPKVGSKLSPPCQVTLAGGALLYYLYAAPNKDDRTDSDPGR